jgi:hypothetical protein
MSVRRVSLHGPVLATRRFQPRVFNPVFSALCGHVRLCCGLSRAFVAHRIRFRMAWLNSCQFDLFQWSMFQFLVGRGLFMRRTMGTGQEQNGRV